MITRNLFESVLIRPAVEDADSLFIVSGYARATMAYAHFAQLKDHNKKVNIKLIVGMSALEGISTINHLSFQRLVTKDFPKQFECRYLISKPPVHSKVYTWKKGEDPRMSFVGSANYTQRGFGPLQRESMGNLDPNEGIAYYTELLEGTIDCRDPQVEKLIDIYEDDSIVIRKRKKKEKLETFHGIDLPMVTTSLLDNKGELPQISGLNWAHRQHNPRELNQAYIRLTSDIYKTKFFPPVKKRFSVLTDDGEVFVCTRAQQNGKAIETPENNSILGVYLRRRLGVAIGSAVKKSDLIKYGRTTIDFYKIDDEAYYLDFSVRRNG